MNGQLGMGAMLHLLGGGSPRNPEDFYEKTIANATLAEDALRLTFTDGTKIRLWDNGQSCCESRYMRTDDDIASIIGQKLMRIEVKKVDEVSAEYETHEICFVEVGTDRSFITIANHNEHNGYYGGFGMSVDVEGDDQ